MTVSTSEITDSDVRDLFPHLKRFKNLQRLDFSSGRLRLSSKCISDQEYGYQATETYSLFKEIVAGLDKLKVLDLSNNRLGGNLADLLLNAKFKLVELVRKFQITRQSFPA